MTTNKHDVLSLYLGRFDLKSSLPGAATRRADTSVNVNITLLCFMCGLNYLFWHTFLYFSTNRRQDAQLWDSQAVSFHTRE